MKTFRKISRAVKQGLLVSLTKKGKKELYDGIMLYIKGDGLDNEIDAALKISGVDPRTDEYKDSFDNLKYLLNQAIDKALKDVLRNL